MFSFDNLLIVEKSKVVNLIYENLRTFHIYEKPYASDSLNNVKIK